MLTKKRNEKGIALVEVIVALGVSITVITSLVSLSIFTLRNSTQTKLLLEGTKMANKEIELVRALRDSLTWQEFINNVRGCTVAANGCYIVQTSSGLQVTSGTYRTNPGTLEEISKVFYATKIDGTTQITATPPDQTVRISVIIRWKVGAQDKSTSVYTDLTNWRSR